MSSDISVYIFYREIAKPTENKWWTERKNIRKRKTNIKK